MNPYSTNPMLGSSQDSLSMHHDDAARATLSTWFEPQLAQRNQDTVALTDSAGPDVVSTHDYCSEPYEYHVHPQSYISVGQNSASSSIVDPACTWDSHALIDADFDSTRDPFDGSGSTAAVDGELGHPAKNTSIVRSYHGCVTHQAPFYAQPVSHATALSMPSNSYNVLNANVDNIVVNLDQSKHLFAPNVFDPLTSNLAFNPYVRPSAQDQLICNSDAVHGAMRLGADSNYYDMADVNGTPEDHIPHSGLEAPIDNSFFKNCNPKPTSEKDKTPSEAKNRPTCCTCKKTFSRAADLQRHSYKHEKGEPLYQCGVEGCGYGGCSRLDKMNSHLKNCHSKGRDCLGVIEVVEFLWQPYYRKHHCFPGCGDCNLSQRCLDLIYDRHGSRSMDGCFIWAKYKCYRRRLSLILSKDGKGLRKLTDADGEGLRHTHAYIK